MTAKMKLLAGALFKRMSELSLGLFWERHLATTSELCLFSSARPTEWQGFQRKLHQISGKSHF